MVKKLLLLILFSFNFILYNAQPPANYYNGTASLTGAALKSKLKQIITAGHNDRGYNGLYNGYNTTDRDYFYENDGTVLDIYSEKPNGADPYNFNPGSNQCGNYSNEGDCYNREHIIPQSLFSEGSPMKNDIHTVRPTDGKVNGMRSNYPYGKVGSASFTSLNGSKLGNSISPGYSGTVFEPIDEFKGDVARMIFYFVTRYETQLSGFSSGNMLGNSAYPGLQNWQLQQMMAWHILDPVSNAEIARNNASYTFQGNRNPFIDNPQWVNDIWGTPDTTAPSAPSNLTASNPTTNSISLNWSASTDNTGIAGYDIYMNGTFHSFTASTSTTISSLSPATTYTFYIIAKDLSGNTSTASNTVTETTLSSSIPPAAGGCGLENFEGIPSTNSNSYIARTWTNNNITWNASDARTDDTINNKALIIRNGNLTSSNISGGIASLTLTTQLKYSGSSGDFEVQINGVTVGTIPYSTSVTTTTINNINITGNVVIKIIQPISGNRVALDDLSWSCYTLSTSEFTKEDEIALYPNPVLDGELFAKGNDLRKIQKIEIYALDGKRIKEIISPFKNSNKIDIKFLPKGIYIIKLDSLSKKIIVK